MNGSISWNWTEFCGPEGFDIWSGDGDLNQCFQISCLQIPVLSLIAVISSYYSGMTIARVTRTHREDAIIKLRMLFSLLMALTPAIRIIYQMINSPNSIYLVNYLFSCLEAFSWFIHLCYLSCLRHKLGPTLRGPVILGSLWSMYYVICIIRGRSTYLDYVEFDTPENKVKLIGAVVTLFLQTMYGFTLIPSEDTDRDPVEFHQEDTQSSLLGHYTRFREDLDPHYLGVAMQDSGLISRIFFRWVDSLMQNGVKGKLKNSDDVYDLPDELMSSNLGSKLNNALNKDGEKKLLRALHACFAKEFYSVGLLKLMSDLMGFGSPLILNKLILFVENRNEPILNGYIYAGAIFLTTFFGSFFMVHFSYGIGKISLKLRGALVTKIYQKTLSLSPAVASKTSVGEIINHISTDMDRIAGSCESFHSVWSIPFQIVVTLYLLYLQVGIAFIAGIVFSFLLIPINKLITSKICSLSISMMTEKDKRVNLMTEVIKGIRTIKLHVWEEYFISKILGIRKEELKYLKGRKYLDALCVYFWATTPVSISILTFTTYIFLGGKLTAAVVFTSIALLNMLISPLNAFPWVLNGLIEALVSLDRVQTFLQLEEINAISPSNEETCNDDGSDYAICIKDGLYTRSSQIDLHLDLEIKKGDLVGVNGPVGSGKSTLLLAIIGEMKMISGTVAANKIEQGIGYVSQELWVQQGTVRDNILFGKPYEAQKYRKVVEACALLDDFEEWLNNDLEVVGECGSTLSGGQKARIALARAVYQDKEIYVLDDVLSALDVHIANYIFHKCILELLENKTRIIATHNVYCLMLTNTVILMQDNKITKFGPPKEVLQLDTLSRIDDSWENYNNCKQTTNPDAIKMEPSVKDQIEEETSATGTVSLNVYKSYCEAVGYVLVAIILVSAFFMQLSRNLTDWWLSYWVSVSVEDEVVVNEKNFLIKIMPWKEYGDTLKVKDFLLIYGAIATMNSFSTIIRAFLFAYGGIRAAFRTYDKLLHSILKAKVVFFDVSPLGRILNRFSSDTYTVDDSLPFIINILLASFFSVIGTLCVIIYGMPWMCLFIAPLIPVYHWLQNHYRLTSRELKRLSSVSLSPLFCHFSETVVGLTTIRVLQDIPRFRRENENRLECNQRCRFSSLAASIWLNIRLQVFGILIIGAVCLLSILQHHFYIAHPGLIGLAISYALSLTSKLEGIVNSFTETEREMIAMERICEYIKEPTPEHDPYLGAVLPFAWPSQGVVAFKNVHFKYRDDLRYSLKGVSFQTHPGEKIGIVGRTGAGKSSLFVSLFRFSNLSSGSIEIDAVDIANIPLHKLRSRLTIIPQDPFVFSGCVRENIDVYGRYSDHDLWQAIKQCSLTNLIMNLGGLRAQLDPGGCNLSVGQRQLLCLVRAVLTNSMVVCIDEATANVDADTDKQIQTIIRNVFKQSTVLTIAHRIQTILDSDRVLVMDKSEVVEFGPPETLLQNSDSYFYKLVHEK